MILLLCVTLAEQQVSDRVFLDPLLVVMRVSVLQGDELYSSPPIVVPPNSNMFPDWRKMWHVPWVKIHQLPSAYKTH